MDLRCAIETPPMALIERDRGSIHFEGPEHHLGVRQSAEAFEGRPDQGISRTLPPLAWVDVESAELGRFPPEVGLLRRRGDVAVARELAFDLRDVGEGVLDRPAQPDGDLMSPAVDRQVGEPLGRDDAAVPGTPSGDGHRDDRIGVLRGRLAHLECYWAAFRSERSSCASPRYTWVGLWPA